MSRVFEGLMTKLSDESGYDYDFLVDKYFETTDDPDWDGDVDQFIGITMERDW